MRCTAFAAFALSAIAVVLSAARLSSTTAAVGSGLRTERSRGNARQSVETAFEAVMTASGKGGGEAILRPPCGEEPGALVRVVGSRLADKLDSITAADPNYTWRVVNGVVNLLPHGAPPALLETRLTDYSSGSASNIASAGVLLFALPAVQRAVAALKLTENLSGNALGGVSLEPHPPAKPLRVRFRTGTVLDALNALVRANGHGVWIYAEWPCQGTRLFEIRFAQ